MYLYSLFGYIFDGYMEFNSNGIVKHVKNKNVFKVYVVQSNFIIMSKF